MKNRILTIINLEKISAAQMASLLGIQRSTLSNIIGGRNKPSYDILNSILTKFPNLNFEWLMNGKGNPYKDSDKNLRGEPLFSTTVKITTKEDNNEIPAQLKEKDISSQRDHLSAQKDNFSAQGEPFIGETEENLFSYSPKTEEVNDIYDFPQDKENRSKEENYHPFPVLERGELGNRVEMMQKAKNESIKENIAPSEPSENSVNRGNPDRIAEKKIVKIEVFYSDGTFEEFRR